MTTSVYLTALICYRWTDAYITAIKQERYNTMKEISLVTKSGFKMMLKTLRELIVIIIQYDGGNALTIDNNVSISARV